MGRRGGGGGSAGGGRSGKRNQITYQRVIPKFLRGLVPEGQADPTQAKRESATHHLGKDVEDKRQTRKETPAEHTEEIEALEKQGFSVISGEKDPDTEGTRSSDLRTSQDKTPYKLRSRGIEKTKKSRKKSSAKQLSFDVDDDSDIDDES